MADPRFFNRAGPFTLRELADIAEAELVSNTQDDGQFTDVAPLSSAQADTVSFLDNKLYVKEFTRSSAGACLVRPEYEKQAPDTMSLLITNEPYRAYARVASAFYPVEKHGSFIHPSAHVSEDAILGENVHIGPNAVISEKVEIGSGCKIDANTTIYPAVRVGENCRIFSNVTLQHCEVGDRVIIHPGVRIGQDGFGFAMGAQGHLKVPQLGRVLVMDDVEIGANSTIDRGTGPDTVIGAGSKIDNLVQLGHNVRIGAGCVVVSQVGVSGSTELGNFVVLGGQVGIAGHLKIGDGAQIAAKSGIIADVDPGAKMGGTPAQPMKEWLRSMSALRRMGKKKGKIDG